MSKQQRYSKEFQERAVRRMKVVIRKNGWSLPV
jgi:hypothetical protein